MALPTERSICPEIIINVKAELTMITEKKLPLRERDSQRRYEPVLNVMRCPRKLGVPGITTS